ncbi:MAG: hypothetical protein R3C46_12400 [Hyphomonadaceae bacterium]
MPETTLALLNDYARAIDVLKARGIIRTKNVVGCYAEHLFAHAFDWVLEANSKDGYDAKDGEGRRVQIKSRRVSSTNKSRQLGDMPPDSKIRFDLLAGVVFAPDFIVDCAVIMPRDVLIGLRSGETKRPRFHLREAVRHVEGVRDVTQELREAQSRQS